MGLTFNDLLAKRKLTIYALSKKSGVPRTTIFDISTSKSDILECTGRTLKSISSALDVSIDYLLELEKEENTETCPPFLLESIKVFRKSIMEESSIIDIYHNQLVHCIDVALERRLIDEDKAKQLKERYSNNLEII